MLTILFNILIISLLTSALAAIIVAADIFISNYGECSIDINNGRKKLNVKGGGSLLESLTSEKIFIPSACGGRGSCGYCKVKVIEGAGALLPTEEPYLSLEEKSDNIRLSCQIKVRNDILIEIPQKLLEIKEFECLCEEIRDLTYDIKLFRFKMLNSEKINYIPGQYVQLLTPVYKGSSEEVYRAYSIASNPSDKSVVDLIIRLVPGGICTTYCFKYLKTGDKIKLNGPYGDFRLSDTDAPIIFIAGGSGMAPILCMLYQMKNVSSRRKAVYYFGVNTEKDLFMVDEIKQFEKDLHDFKFVPVMARPENETAWQGEKGLVTEAVQKNLKNACEYEAYLCGSPGMIDASIAVLKNLGMPETSIFYDKFA